VVIVYLTLVQQICYCGCVLWATCTSGLSSSPIACFDWVILVECSSVSSYVFESLYNLIAYCPLSLTLYAARTMCVRCYNRVLLVYVLNNVMLSWIVIVWCEWGILCIFYFVGLGPVVLS
jgi:hypothetical protein